MFKRIALLVLTNFAIMAAISIVIGVLTRSDLLDFLAHHRQPPAT